MTALEDHPDDPHLLCGLGVAERELGMDGVAYERFRATLDLSPEDPLLLATAGTGIAAFDDPEAETALRTAALLGPHLPQVRCMYGAYLSREGMLAEAMAELDAAASLDPEDALIQTERGVAQALSGDLAAAAWSFERATELDPDDGWTPVLLGLLRLELGDTVEAAWELERGARLRPDDFEAQLLAALALAASEGDPDRALEMLERARMRAEDGDASLVLEVESRLDDGPEAALSLLADSMAPSALRERLSRRLHS
jgi:Flp pilus assembly protein TadD